MNKNLWISGLAVLTGLSIASCSKEGYNEVQRTLGASAISIVTSLSNGEVTVVPGTYGFNIKMTDTSNTGTVASPELIANNTSLSFTTNDQSYKSTGYDVYFENATGTIGNSTMELSRANFLAVYLYDETYNKYGYYFDDTEIGDYSFVLNPYAPYIAVAKYDMGSSYRVNTFPIDSFFKGTTVTTYPSKPSGFINDGITYRFIIRRDKDTNVYSADMVMYNARFAEEMPVTLTAVVVKDLDIDFTPTGVKITGANIIPLWFTNGEYLPLERYIFKALEFTTTNDYYTSGRLTYQVGDDYQGVFEGSYLKSYFLGDNQQ